jgi:hypothetical protein
MNMYTIPHVLWQLDPREPFGHDSPEDDLCPACGAPITMARPGKHSTLRCPCGRKR